VTRIRAKPDACDSKVVDENGEPLVVYRSGKASSRITAALKAKGFDGIIISDGLGVDEYVVFAPEQIKSIHNQGTFDPDDPRILYQEKAEPVASISGTEMGADLTADTVVARARDWFRKNLQGKTIERDGLGPVRISGKGWAKLRRGLPADLDRARLIPAIPEIIKSGAYLGRFPTDKERRDDIVAFHHFQASVELSGQTVQAGVSVAEDSRGNLFYNLNRDPEALLEKRKAPRLPGLEARGAEPSEGKAKPSYEQNIALDSSEINISLAGAPLRQQARGSIRFDPGQTRIRLGSNADRSTFLHESGHLFLEQLKADAAAFDNPQVKEDWETVKKWWAQNADSLMQEAVKYARAAKDTKSVNARLAMKMSDVKDFARSGQLPGGDFRQRIAPGHLQRPRFQMPKAAIRRTGAAF